MLLWLQAGCYVTCINNWQHIHCWHFTYWVPASQSKGSDNSFFFFFLEREETFEAAAHNELLTKCMKVYCHIDWIGHSWMKSICPHWTKTTGKRGYHDSAWHQMYNWYMAQLILLFREQVTHPLDGMNVWAGYGEIWKAVLNWRNREVQAIYQGATTKSCHTEHLCPLKMLFI